MNLNNNIFCISILSVILILVICPSCLRTDELGEPFLPEELKPGYQVALNLHNLYRAWHNTPLMTLDDGLNEESQKWADYLAVLGKMQHDYSSRSAGENVFHTWHKRQLRPNTTYLAERAVKYWYFELCDPERWGKDHPNHFTQLVWKSSVRLGLGFSANKNNSHFYVVARYLKTGNYIDRPTFSANVLPVRCNKSVICDGKLGRYNLREESDCEGSNQPEEAISGKPDPRSKHSSSNGGFENTGNLILIWTLTLAFTMMNL